MFSGLPLALCKSKSNTMDRELSKEYLQKQKRRRLTKVGGAILLVSALFTIGFQFVQVKVQLKTVLHAVAELGAVETSFSSSGIVEPYYQEVLTSSLSADILQIPHAAGDKVGPQDTLFIPNVEGLLNEKKKINHEIALKQNQMDKSRQELRKERALLQSNLKKDSISTAHLKSKLEKEKYLFTIGGGSQQKVDQAQIDYQLSCINRDAQVKNFEAFKELLRLDLERMELEFKLKAHERNKILDRLKRAYVQPKIEGIITSILVEPGQHVNEGQPLAQVADNGRFKIEGSIPTRYANRVHLGQRILISVNDSLFKGKLVAISPSVENGSINYTVYPNNPSLSVLRAKLQLELRMIESVNPKAVRIANGDYYFGPGYVDLFVKKGNRLEKRSVKLGGASFDYVEVISGIAPGETVITSKSFNQEFQSYKSVLCE